MLAYTAFPFIQFLFSRFLGWSQDCFLCFAYLSTLDGVPVLAHEWYPLETSFFFLIWGCPQHTVIYENKWDVFTSLMASDLVLARVTDSENTALAD